MHIITSVIALASILVPALAQQIASDPGVAGPPLEIVRLFNDPHRLPTGVAVSKTGRIFVTYPGSLYEKNSNGPTNYTVAELKGNSSEVPYPDLAFNTPPTGRVNNSVSPASGVNYQDYLIAVQGLAIDGNDKLWLLDNARVISDGTLVTASTGGPKLVGIDLANNTVFKTIVFPPSVVFGDSYLNDIRVDVRPSITECGKGVAYITDSSSSGNSGLITVDLGTGESWRHLDGDPRVRPTQQHFLSVWGEPIYFLTGPNLPYGYDSTGSDGIAISADGEYVYWSVTGSRNLFAIPSARLRDHSESSEVLAQRYIQSLGEKGVSDGIDTDSNDLVYVGDFEQNGIAVYHPKNASVTPWLRDPRLGWVDAVIAAPDKHLYLTQNQLWRTPSYYPTGEDRTTRPLVLFRVPLIGNGTNVALH